MSVKTRFLAGRGASQRGLTLIELIVFIVIVSVGLTGVLTVLNITTRSSADPMRRKQMLAIAEAVLEEVRLQPFTWCDPDDANATTAGSTAACAGGTAAETRGSATDPLDNVADYNGAAINASLAGVAYPAGYIAAVEVTSEALGAGGSQVAAADSLRIRVTVTRGAETLVLEGYRTRYAPNALP